MVALMQSSNATTFLAMAAAALSLTSVSAADWPQWRGPNRDGISAETGLLKSWPEGGPRLVWKSTGLGSGYSTVSTVGKRIFTEGDRSDASFVIALNADDGKQIWAAKVGKMGAPGWGGFAGPRATPTVDGDLMFCLDQWGELVCLSVSDGAEKWRKNFEKDFGATRPEWGFSESPLVDGKLVLVTPGGPNGAIVALDKTTGALKWQTKEFTDPAHYSSLIKVEIGGTPQYVQLTAENVVGIGVDGKMLWKAERKGKTAVIPTPVCKGNLVYVSSGYGTGCNLFKVDGEKGNFSATQVYASKVMQNHHGGVILLGDYVYGYSEGKGWTCQDLKTGEAKWQDKSLGKGSLVYADGTFILRVEEKKGTLALIAASPDGYKELGRFDPPDASGKNCWPHPVVSNGRLYIRDQDVLLCYDVKAK
jgi:outer membrane protein assembly factor BamB